jgi:hypothetical protein
LSIRNLFLQLWFSEQEAIMTTAHKKRWSQEVTEKSNALDLDKGVFTWKNPKRIAASLRRSAEQSKKRKSGAFRSAMSMLTFYVNRGGKDLPATQKAVLERAKDELRAQFGRARKKD